MGKNLYRLTKQQQEQALKLATVCAELWAHYMPNERPTQEELDELEDTINGTIVMVRPDRWPQFVSDRLQEIIAARKARDERDKYRGLYHATATVWYDELAQYAAVSKYRKD